MALNKYRGNFAPSQGEIIVGITSRSFSRKQAVDNVVLEIKDISHPSDQTEKCKNFEAKGKLFLTNRGMAWIGKADKKVTSFSSGFGSISRFELKQPVLGANYIRGQTKGEPGEFGFKGTIDWRLTFMDGGAVDWGKMLIATQKNPPTMATFNQPIGGVFFGQQPVTGVQQPDGSFYFPPAGMNMASQNVPPGYDMQNYSGGDRPPQYNAPSASTSNGFGHIAVPPAQQASSGTTAQPSYPGSGGSKAHEAGFR